jgi:hypothetical protein
MSYDRSGDAIFLDPRQGVTIRAFARLAFGSGELSATGQP